MNKENQEEAACGCSGKSSCECCRKEEPRGKLHCFNWLEDIPGGMADSELVEVQFKNTRKGFFRNSGRLPLEIGDMVAVEASPGHDIGEVTLVGRLVLLQMKKAGVRPDSELKRVFRKAKPADIDKYNEARARENDTMIRARRIAADLHLNMKIGDVEYQGDGNKAIFYYIADERVDFRQLIKVLADTFKIRVEMKQIGARQEAGRIGGIGPCGRPLCCASWMTNFVSVGTAAARFQDISLNPQKLAGQCAKLKCCLNFEVDTYVESIKRMPAKEVRLETADATYFHFKFDVFKREITYSTDKSVAANLVTIDAERAFEVMAMNKRGEKPLSLLRDEDAQNAEKKQYNDILGQDITRFDNKKKKRKKSKNKGTDRPADEKQTPQAAPDKDKPSSQNKERKQPRQDDQQNQEARPQKKKQPRKQRLRPGDTPDNSAPDAGRNAVRTLNPAVPPSQRMTK
ncbi:MAG: hypothetical protein HDR77_04305 [Bacteroides sp.]|nr:hypothetical protein [Bacteroides sp.]